MYLLADCCSLTETPELWRRNRCNRNDSPRLGSMSVLSSRDWLRRAFLRARSVEGVLGVAHQTNDTIMAFTL